MEAKLRLDMLLVERGLADSRSRAQALIKDGQVRVNGQAASKPGALYAMDAALEVGEGCPYVSRGGLKLQKALAQFGVDPAGLVCSDSGASTGGFTDCLLQQGAKKVYAIDVGFGQLDPKIAADPRVVVMERTNVRYLTPADLADRLDLAVVDVSFISLSLVLPALRALLAPGGQILCLIKPQFEAGREHVGKKGVVRSAKTHCQVLTAFTALAQSLGMTLRGLTFSPVKGPEGNIEFLGHLALGEEPGCLPDICALVDRAHMTLNGGARP